MIERNIQQAREREMYLKLRDKSFVVDKADVPKIEQWLS